jgi:murein DD-endopeptidase MepM/ murein hydrolase activator NlpD
MRVTARIVLLLAVAALVWLMREDLELALQHSLGATTFPSVRYVRALEDSGLLDGAVGRAWTGAATASLHAPESVTLPLSTDTLTSEIPVSAFTFDVERGRRVDVRVELRGPVPGVVFVDLFEAGDGRARHVAGSVGALTYEAPDAGRFVLRVQAELLRPGGLSVAVHEGPALRFPVQAGRPRDLQSVFGAARDGGRRRHEGVDIFATRGTPVISSTDGIVTRVNETGLGGRVVWVWNPSRSLMLYYAHLDEQRVSAGRRVRTGDVLGTVGNTGNARTTAPHLHFGIYEAGAGAIDPEPYISGDQLPLIP